MDLPDQIADPSARTPRTECYCGSTLNASGRIGTTAADSYCQAAACPGDASQKCGGPFYMRLFKTDASTSAVQKLSQQARSCESSRAY